MARRIKTSAAPAGDIRAFQAFPDFSGVSALADVRVDGQLFTFACSFLGAEPSLHLVAPTSGSRPASKIAADIARRRFVWELERQTTPEYRAATAAFYAGPEGQ